MCLLMLALWWRYPELLVLNLFDTHYNSPTSIFYLPIYSDKESKPEFKKTSYPYPTFPYPWKKNYGKKKDVMTILK